MSLLCNLQFSSHKVVTRRLSLRSILNGVQLCSQILSLHSLNLLVVQVPYLLSVTRVLVRNKLFDQGKNLSNSHQAKRYYCSMSLYSGSWHRSPRSIWSSPTLCISLTRRASGKSPPKILSQIRSPKNTGVWSTQIPNL